MRPGNPWQPGRRAQGSVIKPLILANVIVFLLTGFGNPVNTFYGMLHLHPYFVRHLEFWRLGTYMFVHGGLTHIFFNMWGLFLFGRLVEDRLGSSRFLRLYFISGLMGGAAWLLANWNPNGLYEVVRGTSQLLTVRADPAGILADTSLRVVRAYGGVVGASGAVFGVMLAAAMTAPNMRIMLLFPPVPMKLKTFVAGYAAIEIVLAWTSATGKGQSGIAHLAHLGGLAGAFLYMRRLGRGSVVESLRRVLSQWRLNRVKKRMRVVIDDPDSGFGPSSDDIDRILDKIGRSGMESLTDGERDVLRSAGKRFKEGPGR